MPSKPTRPLYERLLNPYDWNREKRYDWDVWLGKDKFRLTEGVHFDCPRESITHQLRMAASRRGARVVIKPTPAGMVVTVTRKPTKAYPPAKPEAVTIGGGTRGKK